MSDINKQFKEECCPKFEPKKWDNKVIIWRDKLFVKQHVRAIFYMPIGIKRMIMKYIRLIKDAKAMPARSDIIFMASDQTPWGSDYYISVSKKFPHVNIVKISGKFLTKVFEGSFSEMGSWIKVMQKHVADKNKKLEKLYFYHTTCPKCAQKYGKNYVVLLAKIG
jgi:hypothetical protein